MAERRTSKALPITVYVYLTQTNAEHAKGYGRRIFGSASTYINTLICKDRGVKPALGHWQAQGEAKKKRLAREKKNRAKLAYKGRQKTLKKLRLLKGIA